MIVTSVFRLQESIALLRSISSEYPQFNDTLPISPLLSSTGKPNSKQKDFIA